MTDAPRPDEPTADEPTTEPATEDTGLTWAGNVPLDKRWWWSGGLWLILGAGVIAYQLPVITGGEPIALTWAMVVAGLAVMVSGAVQLRRDHAKAKRDASGI